MEWNGNAVSEDLLRLLRCSMFNNTASFLFLFPSLDHFCYSLQFYFLKMTHHDTNNKKGLRSCCCIFSLLTLLHWCIISGKSSVSIVVRRHKAVLVFHLHTFHPLWATVPMGLKQETCWGFAAPHIQTPLWTQHPIKTVKEMTFYSRVFNTEHGLWLSVSCLSSFTPYSTCMTSSLKHNLACGHRCFGPAPSDKATVCRRDRIYRLIMDKRLTKAVMDALKISSGEFALL